MPQLSYYTFAKVSLERCCEGKEELPLLGKAIRVESKNQDKQREVILSDL